MCMVFFFVFFPALFFLPTKPESWCDSQHRLRSLSFAKGGIESTGLFSDLPRVTQGSGVKEGSRRLPSDSWPTTLSPWPYCSLCVACTLCQGNTMLIKDMELTTLKTWQKNFWRISNNKTLLHCSHEFRCMLGSLPWLCGWSSRWPWRSPAHRSMDRNCAHLLAVEVKRGNTDKYQTRDTSFKMIFPLSCRCVSDPLKMDQSQ